MKTERNILVAFLLNAFFSVFELIGGIFTGSVAIVSDAVHDLGDALSIGLAYVLEKKSKKQPDGQYTYGYARYSVLGALITSTILIVGSAFVIANAINRIINPVAINYDGMIIFAIIGASVNFLAAYFTREGDSLNQKAVNLHMLEDVLGWVIVLIGAVTMKFTDFGIIDPILSIFVAAFIMVNALKSYRAILDLFLEKTPVGFDIERVRKTLTEVEGVSDVHHIHIWSMDGMSNYATMHVVSDSDDVVLLKQTVRGKLKELGISHVTLEIEGATEECTEKECHVDVTTHVHGHHHHHHHHGHSHADHNGQCDCHEHHHDKLIHFKGETSCSCCSTKYKKISTWDRQGKHKNLWYDPMKDSKEEK